MFELHEDVRGYPFDVISSHDDALDLRETDVRQLGGHGRNGRETVECQYEDGKFLEGNYLVGKVGQVVVVEMQDLETFKFTLFLICLNPIFGLWLLRMETVAKNDRRTFRMTKHAWATLGTEA